MIRSLTMISVLFFTVAAGAKTIADVRSVDCTDGKGAFLKIDATTQMMFGRLGTLPGLDNHALGGEKFLELKNEYPKSGFSFLGSLVGNTAGDFGSMGIFAETGRALTGQEAMEVLFVTMSGQYQTQRLNCRIGF